MKDHTSQVGCRNRPPGVALTLAVALALGLLSASMAAGCGPGTGASTALDPMTQAYYRAHPGLVDGPLKPAPAPVEKVLADIKADLDDGQQVWLPDYLPTGFVLAAPYNGNGSGSAYPNPYAWGRGYGITYTDGSGYIMVLSNSDDDLSIGEWKTLSQTAAGRSLHLRREAALTIVATADERQPRLLVAGAGFAGPRLTDELIKVAVSLSPH